MLPGALISLAAHIAVAMALLLIIPVQPPDDASSGPEAVNLVFADADRPSLSAAPPEPVQESAQPEVGAAEMAPEEPGKARPPAKTEPSANAEAAAEVEPPANPEPPAKAAVSAPVVSAEAAPAIGAEVSSPIAPAANQAMLLQTAPAPARAKQVRHVASSPKRHAGKTSHAKSAKNSHKRTSSSAAKSPQPPSRPEPQPEPESAIQAKAMPQAKPQAETPPLPQPKPQPQGQPQSRPLPQVQTPSGLMPLPQIQTPAATAGSTAKAKMPTVWTPSTNPALGASMPTQTGLATPNHINQGWAESVGTWLVQHRTDATDARLRNTKGTVVLRFTVARDGSVEEVSVVRSSGSMALDRAAETMLRNSRLPPFPPDMVQSSQSVMVPIHYDLQ